MKKGIDFIGVGIVFYCHDGNGNVLMGKRNVNCKDEHGNWDIGGGGLEFGEHVIDALKREIFEEYCTEILDFEFLGYRDVHREFNGVKTHWVALDFKVLVDRRKVKNGEPNKIDEVRWVKHGEWPRPFHSQFPEFLENYKGKLG
jgi:8-oxo-dGTP diphosphatase